MILMLKNKDTGEWEGVPAIIGPPGNSPFIGANGHWWIGETDTGVPARGEGSGDMLVSAYDDDGAVAAAGGIAAYVAEHGGSGGEEVDLTGYATETWVEDQLEEYQPKGSYLTAVPEGYAKTEDIPTALSQLSPDANNQRVANYEKAYWNSKSDFSGSYIDLTNKPTIPTVDMKAADYDANGAVKSAGGIAAYVTANAGDQTVVTGTATAKATSSTHKVMSGSSVTYHKVGHVCFVHCNLVISPASNGYQYYTIDITGLPIMQDGAMISKVNYCYANYTRTPTEEVLTTNGSGVTLQLGFDAAVTSNLELEYSIIGYVE